MLDVKLCTACYRALQQKLQMPAVNEPAFLESVAKQIHECSTCRPQALRLRKHNLKLGAVADWAKQWSWMGDL